jgi:hypothetical protein
LKNKIKITLERHGGNLKYAQDFSRSEKRRGHLGDLGATGVNIIMNFRYTECADVN